MRLHITARDDGQHGLSHTLRLFDGRQVYLLETLWRQDPLLPDTTTSKQYAARLRSSIAWWRAEFGCQSVTGAIIR